MIKWFFADLLQSFSCLTVLSSQHMLTGHQTVDTGVSGSIFLMALVYYLYDVNWNVTKMNVFNWTQVGDKSTVLTKMLSV